MKFSKPLSCVVVSLSIFGAVGGSAIADHVITPETMSQTLTMPSEGFLGNDNNLLKSSTFSRLDVEIIDEQPWLKPEKANQKLSESELVSMLSSV